MMKMMKWSTVRNAARIITVSPFLALLIWAVVVHSEPILYTIGIFFAVVVWISAAVIVIFEEDLG
jgi:hypothetical protein